MEICGSAKNLTLYGSLSLIGKAVVLKTTSIRFAESGFESLGSRHNAKQSRIQNKRLCITTAI